MAARRRRTLRDHRSDARGGGRVGRSDRSRGLRVRLRGPQAHRRAAARRAMANARGDLQALPGLQHQPGPGRPGRAAPRRHIAVRDPLPPEPRRPRLPGNPQPRPVHRHLGDPDERAVLRGVGHRARRRDARRAARLRGPGAARARRAHRGARRRPAPTARRPARARRLHRRDPGRAGARQVGLERGGRRLRAARDRGSGRARADGAADRGGGPDGAGGRAGVHHDLAGPFKGPPGTSGSCASRAGRSSSTASRCRACPSTGSGPSRGHRRRGRGGRAC